MDKSKLYETCTIIARTVTNTDWTERFSESTVASNIPCYVKPISGNMNVGGSENTNVERVKIIIDKGNTVSIGNIVTVGTKRYEVEEVKAYSLISNGNIAIKCVKI